MQTSLLNRPLKTIVMTTFKFNHMQAAKPAFFKSCMILCITAILSIFLFACNSAKQSSSEADSAATAMPKVDSTSVIPVDTSMTKPDTTQQL